MTRVLRLLSMMLLVLIVMTFAVVYAAGEVPTAPDWTALGAAIVTAVSVPLIIVVTWLSKIWIPKIPRVALPFVAAALAQLAAFVAGLATGHGYNAFIAALLTTASVYIREVVHTAAEHGANP